MGHIKGSLGHGGWYLTQIHIFHSDGRGTMEGSGRVRVGCVWVVGLLEHAEGGWLERCGGVGPRVSERKRWCASVCMCARVEWVGIRMDRTGLVRSCHEGSWYAGTQACGAPASPYLLFTLSPPTPVQHGARMFGRGSVATPAVGCTVRARTPTKQYVHVLIGPSDLAIVVLSLFLLCFSSFPLFFSLYLFPIFSFLFVLRFSYSDAFSSQFSLCPFFLFPRIHLALCTYTHAYIHAYASCDSSSGAAAAAECGCKETQSAWKPTSTRRTLDRDEAKGLHFPGRPLGQPVIMAITRRVVIRDRSPCAAVETSCGSRNTAGYTVEHGTRRDGNVESDVPQERHQRASDTYHASRYVITNRSDYLLDCASRNSACVSSEDTNNIRLKYL